MYTPPAFREDDPEALRDIIRAARLSSLVTMTAEGLVATAIPFFLDDSEGPHGTLYGHMARANRQWQLPPAGDALVIFSGPDAYVTPSWYASKAEHGKVVPTWNYTAVHAHGPVEFFDDEARLRDIVTRLTDVHEEVRAKPWSVADAPDDYIRAHLRGVVGIRLPVARLEAARKMSQNKSEADRAGVAAGLAQSERTSDHELAKMIPLGPR